MKVAIVTQYPADFTAPQGGVEAVSVTLCSALSKVPDLDLHVVTVNRDVAQPTVTTSGSLTIHRLPYLGGSVLTNAIGAGRRQMQAYVSNLAPDVVHAHDTYGLMTVGLDMPRALTIHGFIYGDTLVSGTRFASLRSKIWRHYETSGWADQPYIISISPYVRERLSGIARGTIYDIDNPIDESFFDIAATSAARPIVLSAAVISPRKNTLLLIEAFAREVRSGVDAELRLAGAVTNAEYGEKVRRMIEGYGIGDRVKLLGSIKSAGVRDQLRQASVFALVSLEENSPIGIEEAMAAKVPVLTSNRCGMPYMVRHGESGFLVNPVEVDEISTRLGELLRSQDLRHRMGICGHQIALDRYHPAVVARRTREVYIDAVTAQKRRANTNVNAASR